MRHLQLWTWNIKKCDGCHMSVVVHSVKSDRYEGWDSDVDIGASLVNIYLELSCLDIWCFHCSIDSFPKKKYSWGFQRRTKVFYFS